MRPSLVSSIVNSQFLTVPPKAYAGVMDLCLAALPWTILPKLQMKTKEKIGVGIAMSMGALYVKTNERPSGILCALTGADLPKRAGAAAFAKCAVLPALSSGDFTCEFLNSFGRVVFVGWHVSNLDSFSPLMQSSAPTS